jgi:hypothetical protein
MPAAVAGERRTNMELTRTTQPTSLDWICSTHTAFKSFDALVNSFPGYRPTLDVSNAALLMLADAYDAFQQARGDERRAERRGVAA